jgi:hypothetical protein
VELFLRTQKENIAFEGLKVTKIEETDEQGNVTIRYEKGFETIEKEVTVLESKGPGPIILLKSAWDHLEDIVGKEITKLFQQAFTG